MTTARSPRNGTVILAVLIVVVLLALAAYQYGELMTAEYRAADSAVRAAQAHAIAVSGVHYTAAALADSNTLAGRLNNNVYDNGDFFRGVETQSNDNERMRGRFSIISPQPIDDAINGGSGVRFGVIDEASKVNINALISLDSTGQIAYTALTKLPNMTEEIADAIIDWIDADDEPRSNGAENDFYGALGYRCKNGPLDTLEELLLVRGVTPQLLFGSDTNRNGMLDANEDQSNGFDPGWAGYLTVYSRELNRALDNEPRINVNDSDISGLYDKLNTALGEELANWIVAYRIYGGSTSGGGGGSASSGSLTKEMLGDLANANASNRVSYIADLIESSVSIPQGGGGGSSTTATAVSSTGAGTVVMTRQSGGGGGGRNQPGGGGSPGQSFPSPLRDDAKRRELLPLLYDKVTTQSTAEISGRININTAPRAVLMMLPQLEETDVETILSSRPVPGQEGTDTTFQSPSWIVTQADLPVSKLRSIERYITTRAQTYRVQSLGYFDKGGPVARVEAVIDTNGGQPRILLFRDLSELGRGFEIPR